jgi:hypothetical protein
MVGLNVASGIATAQLPLGADIALDFMQAAKW